MPIKRGRCEVTFTENGKAPARGAVMAAPPAPTPSPPPPPPPPAPPAQDTVWDAALEVEGSPGVAVDDTDSTIVSVGWSMGIRGTRVRSSGKAYFEIEYLGGPLNQFPSGSPAKNAMFAGIHTFTPFDPTDPNGDYSTDPGGGVCLFWSLLAGEAYTIDLDNNWDFPSTGFVGTSWTAADPTPTVLQVAVDFTGDGTVTFGINDIWGTDIAVPWVKTLPVTPTFWGPFNDQGTPWQLKLRTTTDRFLKTMPVGYTAFDDGAVLG